MVSLPPHLEDPEQGWDLPLQKWDVDWILPIATIQGAANTAAKWGKDDSFVY